MLLPVNSQMVEGYALVRVHPNGSLFVCNLYQKEGAAKGARTQMRLSPEEYIIVKLTGSIDI